MEGKNNMKGCQNFNTCNAPLCPLDEEIEHRTFFADEDICKVKEFSNRLFIKNQKKLKKVGAKDDCGFFTYRMLNRNIIIKKGIQGLDPDSFSSTKTLENNWIKKHPEISKKRIAAARNNIKIKNASKGRLRPVLK